MKISHIRKEAVIIFICVILVIVCLVFCICVAFSKPKTNKPTESNTEITQENTEIPAIKYPPESPKSLKYQSLGSGTCTIAGIGEYAGSELEIPDKSPYGENVISISKNAFKDCNNLVSVNIPSSVKIIEEGAFSGCGSLTYINVDRDNPQYSSYGGVLYSKGRTSLILYPQNRIGETYLLDPNIKCIMDNAFDGVKNLSKILYEGSPSEFDEINIGKGNKVFTSLPITCNYTNGK